MTDKLQGTHMGPKESTGHFYLEGGKLKQCFVEGASVELLRWREWRIWAKVECGIGAECCQQLGQEKMTETYNNTKEFEICAVRKWNYGMSHA